jgi:fucose 4-O-acetylase-like acetyltransferase
MSRLSIGTGIILTVLGLGGYAFSGGVSPTALIPAAFGILFIVFGYLARKESMRRHAMHGAALLSLLGIIGSFKGTVAAVTMLGGGVVERPQAAIAQAVMAVTCFIFLVLAIRSFVNARLKPAPPQNP